MSNSVQDKALPIIAWFSCGATSAVACKYALQMYENVRIVYIETHTGHPDNERFIKECEEWYGQPIEIRSSNKYKNVEDVLLRTHYINGATGAACTYHLKKKVRYELEEELGEWGGQVWGFEFSKNEINRAIRFQEQNPDNKPLFPLIEKELSKPECLSILQKAGIEIPYMYRLGYHNNNCIGCVKGGMGYWNKIRVDFPDTFEKMAQIERKVGASCLKDEQGQVFLDELPPDRGADEEPIVPECGLFCDLEFQNLMDKRVKAVLSGKRSIYLTPKV